MAKDTVLELCLRLNEAETQTLCADAKRCSLNRNAYLRRLILGKSIKALPTGELRDLYTEVNRIGNNINQIARSVNARITTVEDAAQALLLLKKVYAVMEEVADK